MGKYITQIDKAFVAKQTSKTAITIARTSQGVHFKGMDDEIFLTHWGPVTHICINKLGYQWFR